MNRKNLIIISIATASLVIFAVLLFKIPKIGLKIDNKESYSLNSLFSQAKGFEEKGDLQEAKKIYQKLVSDFPGSNEVMNWQKKIEDMNIRLLFSPYITPKSLLYEVKPGDTLAKIAKEFKTTVDLIMRSNNLKDAKIYPGRKIKVWTAPFTVLVDKSSNTLTLKNEEEIIKTYIVATGKNNTTPVGVFKITNKLTNPPWFKKGAVIPPNSPENILGTRWMGFDLSGYGIHGTTEPETLGRQVTDGCVRMSNTDVEELYTIIPEGTEVTVID